MSANLWIKKESEELFSEYLKKTSNLFDFLSESDDNIEFCIKCHDYTFKVLCPYCFTHSVYKVLESINWIKAEKFKIVFDYDLEKAGFEKCGNEDMIHVKNFEPLVFDADQNAVLDVCDDCGSASYFANENQGEKYCESCCK